MAFRTRTHVQYRVSRRRRGFAQPRFSAEAAALARLMSQYRISDKARLAPWRRRRAQRLWYAGLLVAAFTAIVVFAAIWCRP
jgi:hypothetical protein